MSAPTANHQAVLKQPNDDRRLAILLATSGHSGVDTVMTNLIRAFAAAGRQVDLLRIRNHGPYLDSVPENVRLVDLGVGHINTALLPLIRYLRRTRPYALLTDKDRLNRIALWARWAARVPTRVSIRMGTTISIDLPTRPALDRWLQTLSIRHLYRRADSVLVPSQGAADDLAQFAGLPRSRIHVVPSPVVTRQLQLFAARRPDHPWFHDQGPPVILGVGELSGRKDFATLVHAFAKVRTQYPCRLMILGEGRRRGQLEELARKLNIGEHVALPGFISPPYPYMAHAALFVLPSRWEGMPVVLIEALALGTPVVATDCPSGPRELLDGGRYGDLVPVGNADALAAAILRTLQQPPDQEFLRGAVQRYTLENSAREYLRAMGFPGMDT